MFLRAPSSVRLVLVAAAALVLACGSDPAPTPDAGPAGPPVRIDGGLPDGGVIVDGGVRDGGPDRASECARYCQKLFACGYLPRPGQPSTFTQATCTSQCGNLGGYPPDELRGCVATSQCACDGGAGCTPVTACFPSVNTDGGN